MTGTYFTIAGFDGWQSAGVDANGSRWVMNQDTLSGWFDPPNARESYVARVGNGSFDAPVYDDDRVISWAGTVDAPDLSTRESVKLLLSRISRALRDGADVTGNDDDGIPKTVHSRRSGSWKIADLGLTSVQYQATVRCADPYRYGPAVTVTTGLATAGSGGLVYNLFDGTGKLEFGTVGATGRVSLANAGSQDAWPVYTITGPMLGGVSITDIGAGRQIVYVGDVPSGAKLVIDTTTGRAKLNGSDRTGQLTVKQWSSVPPFGTATIQFATLGATGQTGTLAAALRPTYQ